MGAHAQKNDHTHKTRETNYWNKVVIFLNLWQQIGLLIKKDIFQWHVDLIFSDINDRDIKSFNRIKSRSITFCSSSIKREILDCSVFTNIDVLLKIALETILPFNGSISARRFYN